MSAPLQATEVTVLAQFSFLRECSLMSKVESKVVNSREKDDLEVNLLPDKNKSKRSQVEEVRSNLAPRGSPRLPGVYCVANYCRAY